MNKLLIKDIPKEERPRERFIKYGVSSLSNEELIAIILKTGSKNESVINLAQKVLSLIENQKSLRFLQEISIEELMNVKGIGRVKAIELKAMCEIAKRMSRPIKGEKIVIKAPQDVANLLLEELRYEKREIAKVILLNSKNIVLKIVDIAFGGANFAMIEPKEVLSEAIKMNVPNMILIHNHPSGDSTPSNQDYHLTDRIFDCCDLMGIRLLDHIVIGDGTFSSIMTKTKDRKYKK